MPISPTGSPSRTRRLFAVICLLSAAAAYTAFWVHYSSQHYKLAGFPIVDDVYYFTEGLRILMEARQSGWPSVVPYLWNNPPHSPLSSLTCTIVFALFGVSDWLPYAANGICVLLLLFFVTRLAAHYGLTWSAALSLGALALAAPLTSNSILIYQPIFPCALLTALGAAAYLSGWPVREPLRQAAAAAAWALALLAKPTVFPQILLLLISSGALALITLRGSKASLVPLARGYVVNLIGILAAVSPYYAAAIKEVVRYIHIGTAHSLVAYDGGAAAQLLYYVTGPGGRPMLGSLWYTGVLLGAVSVYVVIRAGKSKELRLVYSLIALDLLAYITCTINPHKHEELGQPFQYLFLITVLVSIAAAAGTVRHSRWLARALIAGTLVSAAAAVTRPSGALADTAAWQARNRALAVIVGHLATGSGIAHPRVFLTSAGFITVNTLWYQFAKHNRPLPDFHHLSLSDDLRLYSQEMDDADWVIATEPGNPDVPDFLPSSKVQRETLALAMRHKDLELVAKTPTWQGAQYWLFRRRAMTPELSSLVMSDPRSSHQLLFGFHGLEGGAWRWCARSFGVVLLAPQSRNATLEAEVFVPEIVIKRFRMVRLRANVGPVALAPETFIKPGVYQYIRTFPLAGVPVDRGGIKVNFQVDRAIPADARDARERAIVVRSIQLSAAVDN